MHFKSVPVFDLPDLDKKAKPTKPSFYSEPKPDGPGPSWRNLPPFEAQTSSPDSNQDSTQRECSHEDYDFMKENLLVFNNEKLMDSKKSGESPST